MTMAATSSYAIDPGTERLVHVSDIPALVERWGARRPHRNAITRWRTAGLRGIQLPTVLVGGRRYSSEAALRWWVAATSAASTDATAPTHPPGSGSCTASQRAALVRAGILTE